MADEKKSTEEKLPAEVRANMLSTERTIFFNVALFEQAQRIAKMFAESTMVPDHFRGNIGNCMIALNYATRLQADPFMVTQCLYVVHGNPGIEGKLVEATINQSNKYSEPLQYEWLDPEDKSVERRIVLNHKDFGDFGCQAFSIDAKSNKRVDGPKISWKLVKAEGWYDKNGSKWQTMPEMMFYYRAASWFANKNCPEVKLGMHTVEELQDIVDLRPRQNGSYGIPTAAKDLTDLITQFDASIPKDVDLETLQKFLAASAQHFDKTVEEIKAEAIQDDNFWNQFREWAEKEKPSEKDKEDPIRAAYINLKKTGFKPYVEANLEAISNLAGKYRAEIRAKWEGFYPDEPCPLLNHPATPIDPDPNLEPEKEDDHDKFLRLVDGAEETTSGLACTCPDNPKGIRALKTRCENCSLRDGCPSWANYDAE